MNHLLNLSIDKEEFKIFNKLLVKSDKLNETNTYQEINIKNVFYLNKDNKFITPKMDKN